MEISQDAGASEASTTEAATTSVESTPSAVDSSPKETSSVNVATDAAQAQPAAPQTPAFTPVYKVKAYDKEYEIPEMYRPLIKDQVTQKQVQEIFEKAYALDEHKVIHTGLKEKFNQYQEQTAPLIKIAQELDYYQKKGDLGSYFKTLGFNDQQIMEYALQKAQQLELSPEQKRVYDEREQANRQQFMLEQQFQQTQERLQNLMVQQRNVELQTVLSRPDVQSFVQAFDQRNGQGAFSQECIQQGRSYFALTGKDLTAEEVVQGIVKKFATPMQHQQQMMPQQHTPKAPAEVPVIPNTGSSSGSPSHRAIRSIDDLKRLASEKFATE